MNPAVKSALVRAGRTFAQAFLGTYIALIVTADSFAGLWDRTALEAGGVAGVIALLSFGQNLLEGRRDVSYDRG